MRSGGNDGGGEPKPFAGVRFKLLGFSPSVEKQHCLALENGGAERSMFFGPDSKCTHVIVQTPFIHQEHEWCIKAQKGNAIVVNQLWLNQCISTKKLVPHQQGFYKPAPAGAILGSRSLNICCAGYGPEKTKEIKLMTDIMGGSFSENWNRQVSHTICFRFEGETYKVAKENGAKIVNENWLRESINAWKILSPENYQIPGEKVHGNEENPQESVPLSAETSSSICFRTPNAKLIRPSPERLSESTGSKKHRAESEYTRRKIHSAENYQTPSEKAHQNEENPQESLPVPLSAENSSSSIGFRTPTERVTRPSPKRLSKSTGNKKQRTDSDKTRRSVIRSLKYSPDRRFFIDEYVKPDDRVVTVKYPFSATSQRSTAPILKRILKKAYRPLVYLHNANLSLEGNFSSDNFVVSDPNELVELYDVVTSELTPEGRQVDKKSFVNMVKSLYPKEVPTDVEIWMKNIIEGWEDALLLNHIYMTDPELAFGQFLTMYYCLEKLEKNDSFKYKTFKDSLSEYDTWFKDGFKWSMLEENKEYKDQREAALASLAGSHGKQPKKRKEDPFRKNVHGALRTIKNTWSHPASALQEFFLAIILHEYEELLSKFQKAMYDSRYYGKNLSIK